jgi:hypothetical protein
VTVQDMNTAFERRGRRIALAVCADCKTTRVIVGTVYDSPLGALLRADRHNPPGAEWFKTERRRNQGRRVPAPTGPATIAIGDRGDPDGWRDDEPIPTPLICAEHGQRFLTYGALRDTVDRYRARGSPKPVVLPV